MKSCLLKAIAVLSISSVSMFAQAATTEGPTLQVLMENNKPMIINAAGDKTALTLGTLLDSTAQAWMTGTAKATPSSAIDPKAIALIKLNKTDGAIEAMLYDNKSRNEELNLGNLIAAAAQTYPGCTAEQINGKSVDIKLNFKTDANGNVQAFYTDAKGKDQPFNLGSLLRDTTLRLNDCKK